MPLCAEQIALGIPSTSKTKSSGASSNKEYPQELGAQMTSSVGSDMRNSKKPHYPRQEQTFIKNNQQKKRKK